MVMEIKLNGEIRQIKDGMTLQELVDSLQLPNRALAVAVNRTVITRQKWPEVVLYPADQVELVRAIGGG
ncbi:sulfur carrier protein ThiS [Oxalobacter aliiformigenes]|nr:sulfur carrier protein ThiS [Oxalobacter aliiformigenes]WAV90210.1 sulfur carrier protein ThiS [Oxalobacter aliiformigenes]